MPVLELPGPEKALALFSERGTLSEYDSVHFGEDFSLVVRLPEGYHSEVPAPFLDSYYRQQQQLLRIIALIENGNSDIKTLTSAQLEQYQFKLQVKDGSSELSDNTQELLTRLATEAFGKMTGDQAMVVVLGSGPITPLETARAA